MGETYETAQGPDGEAESDKQRLLHQHRERPLGESQDPSRVALSGEGDGAEEVTEA